MTLREKQSRFCALVALLIQHAVDVGYDVTFGETYRSNEQATINSLGVAGREEVAQLVEAKFPSLAGAMRDNGKAGGILHSVHCDRLAVDLNLFREGVFVTGAKDHRPLGVWWEQLDPLCRWGGRFGESAPGAGDGKDANHYSLEHEGRA